MRGPGEGACMCVGVARMRACVCACTPSLDPQTEVCYLSACHRAGAVGHARPHNQKGHLCIPLAPLCVRRCVHPFLGTPHGGFLVDKCGSRGLTTQRTRILRVLDPRIALGGPSFEALKDFMGQQYEAVSKFARNPAPEGSGWGENLWPPNVQPIISFGGW